MACGLSREPARYLRGKAPRGKQADVASARRFVPPRTTRARSGSATRGADIDDAVFEEREPLPKASCLSPTLSSGVGDVSAAQCRLRGEEA